MGAVAPDQDWDRTGDGRAAPVAHRRRRHGWGWPWVIGLSALTLLPALLSAVLLAPEDPRAGHVESITWVFANVLILLAATMLYVRFRMTGVRALGWLAAGLAMFAVHAIPLWTLSLSDDQVAGLASWSGDHFDLTLVLPLLAVAHLARLEHPLVARVDPLAFGITLGATTGALRLGNRVWQIDGTVAASGAASVALYTVVLAVGVLVIVAIARLDSVHPRLRHQLTTVAGGLLLAYAIHWSLPVGLGLRGFLALALTLASAILLTVTALRLLRGTLEEQRLQLDTLLDRLESAEEHVQHDEEVLHELRSTVAGINAASRLLINDEAHLPRQRRARLQGMLEVEMGRLERLISRPAPQPVVDVDLDEVIEAAVLAQAAQGATVRWHPSGVTVRTRLDHVAEVVHILLVNATTHAEGARVWVSVSTRPGVVEVRVCDDGPGIASELRRTIFQRGFRANGSRGQGIGLYVAHRLVHEMGGTLSFEEPNQGNGSCFVVRLPVDPKESR